MTHGLDAPLPFNPHNPPRLYKIPVVTATPENIEAYGKLFKTSEIESVENMIQAMPPVMQVKFTDPIPGGFRSSDPNTGLAESNIKGKFSITYDKESEKLIGKNHGVASKDNDTGGQYTIGWFLPRSNTLVIDEFNNHKSGSQDFCVPSSTAGAILFVAATPKGRHSDYVELADAVGIYIPPGHTFRLYPRIYHQPVLTLNKKTEIYFTQQDEIHESTTCDFFAEKSTFVAITLEKPAEHKQLNKKQQIITLLQNAVHMYKEAGRDITQPMPKAELAIRNSIIEKHCNQANAIAEQLAQYPENSDASFIPNTTKILNLLKQLPTGAEKQLLLARMNYFLARDNSGTLHQPAQRCINTATNEQYLYYHDATEFMILAYSVAKQAGAQYNQLCNQLALAFQKNVAQLRPDYTPARMYAEQQKTMQAVFFEPPQQPHLSAAFTVKLNNLPKKLQHRIFATDKQLTDDNPPRINAKL